MTRSRQRKLKRHSQRTHLEMSPARPLAAAVAAAIVDAGDGSAEHEEGVLENVIVTAQKRTENLQEVPLSIQALGTRAAGRAARRRTSTTTSATCRRSPTRRSGRASRRSTCAASRAAATATTRARCRASACTWTSSRSRRSRARSTCTCTTSRASRRWPDRKARCTARARRRARSASSRNKPDATEFSAGYDLEGSTMTDGGAGYLCEGLREHAADVDSAAVRLVGWKQHDPGFIDNVSRPRTFPSSVEHRHRAARHRRIRRTTTTTPTRPARVRR